jgi:hypothetical protein
MVWWLLVLITSVRRCLSLYYVQNIAVSISKLSDNTLFLFMWIFFPLNIKICTHDILYVMFPACWSSHADAVTAEIWRLFSSFISLCLHLLWKMLGIATSVLFDVNLGSVGLSLLACFLIEINCVLHTAASNIRSSYFHFGTLLAFMCVYVEIELGRKGGTKRSRCTEALRTGPLCPL